MATRKAGGPDPALSMRFDVTIDGVDLGAFTAVDGLAAEYDIVEYAEGGNNAFTHRLPGRLKYRNVRLTRAIDAHSGALATWFTTLQTSVSRKTAAITAYDGQSKKVASWSLVGVWPVKYTGPTLSSDGTLIAKETLEIAHNGFTVG